MNEFGTLRPLAINLCFFPIIKPLKDLRHVPGRIPFIDNFGWGPLESPPIKASELLP